MRLGLDANCFIDRFNPASPNHDAAALLFEAGDDERVTLLVSRHTLTELGVRRDEALELAESLPVLRHWPIGTWGEQVAAWNQLEGTWADAARHQGLQQRLKALAKTGTDIRDRGAALDALLNGVDGFVTSDGALADPKPAARIREATGLRVLTPRAAVEGLGV